MELDKVCKLIKTLYKLKQAPYIWHKTLVKFFKMLGFTQLEFDYKIFVLVDKRLFIAVYINDLLIFNLDLPHIENIL